MQSWDTSFVGHFLQSSARPHAKVIAICGDASFQMHAQELATAVEQEAPFLAVVLNDMMLASIRNAQLKKYGKDFGTSFRA